MFEIKQICSTVAGNFSSHLHNPGCKLSDLHQTWKFVQPHRISQTIPLRNSPTHDTTQGWRFVNPTWFMPDT